MTIKECVKKELSLEDVAGIVWERVSRNGRHAVPRNELYVQQDSELPRSPMIWEGSRRFDDTNHIQNYVVRQEGKYIGNAYLWIVDGRVHHVHGGLNIDGKTYRIR